MATKGIHSKAQLWRHVLGQRLGKIGPIYLGVFLGMMTLLWALEHGLPETKFPHWADTIWFGVVTISTTGYGDLYPISWPGKIVTGTFILFTLTTVGFLLAAVNEAVLEVKRMEEAGLLGTKMKEHVVMFGFSPMVRVSLIELIAAGEKVALICDRPEDIPMARQLGPANLLFVTSGEATAEFLNERVNFGECQTAVVASMDDTLNLITALNMRQASQKPRVVVALSREELRQTLMASGVTYVASPNELSGRLVASAAFEPEVAKFVEDVTSAADDGFDLQQYRAQPLAGRSVGEVRGELEAIDGPLLVALGRKQGEQFEILSNPKRSEKILADDYLIVLTNDEQAKHLQEKYGLRQGRH